MRDYTQAGTEFAGYVSHAYLALMEHSQTVHLKGIMGADYKNRGFDNYPIRTSYINEILYVADGDLTIITTRNSTYLVKGNLLSEQGLGKITQVTGAALEEMVLHGDLKLPRT